MHAQSQFCQSRLRSIPLALPHAVLPGPKGFRAAFGPAKSRNWPRSEADALLVLANWTTDSLILYAHGGPIRGGPAWISSERYVVDLKVDDSLAYQGGKLIEATPVGQFPVGLQHDQLRLMILSLG